jgi:hypothetical protein
VKRDLPNLALSRPDISTPSLHKKIFGTNI